MRFTDKTAVITGAARGIGAATALRLAREGAHVAVVDIDPDGAVASAQAISADAEVIAAGGSATGLRADVTRLDDLEAVVAQVVADRAAVDIFVNNAGLTRDNLLHKLDSADWDLVIATNLTATFNGIKAAQAVMVPQRSGRIVNLSSRSALGNRGQANYAAAKAGIQGLTATAAIELGPFGITVNAVAPGFIATPMTDATAARVGMSAADYQSVVAERTPLGRVGQPEEVAAAVAFFASEDASYVSGQTLYLNGGAR
ncbi:SDR family oxidoreductase [Salinibacterium sp. ZJ454]|uniref:SDR family oxidoreductase n=1 Tax=Salinibacterium sp. ZJ454 TaxID=2708339 RepID=UPI00141E868C|nr:SDR family oxidoreductase [Salinibacterium sp. ZJ454]